MVIHVGYSKEQTAIELETRDGDWVSNADIKEQPQRWAADSEGFTTDESNLPKGYYYGPYFLGTFVAMGLGFWAGVSGFGYAAPVLSIINADIGPDPNIQWVALIHPVALSIGMTIVGRLSDIFGRRWFFIGGAFLAMIASIISALSTSVPMLIVGATIKGVAASTQLSCFYTISELVPMKYRYIANGILYVWQIPGTGFAPAVSQSLIENSGLRWRSIFWLLTALNGGSMICWFIFYHPPTFQDKNGTVRRMTLIKNFDYIGAFLYAVGLVLFLLGLSWGGSTYPWNSAIVISFIVIGFATLVSFVLWESYAPLEEPLVPVALFTHRPYVVSVILAGLGAGVYYAGAIIWPPLTRIMWANGDSMLGAYLSCIAGLAVIAGQIIGGLLARSVGKQKIQATVSVTIGGALLAAVSIVTPDNRAAVCALLFLGVTLIGYNEIIALSNAMISIPNHQEIGTAGGLATAGRASIAAVCQTVYNTILSNRLLVTIPQIVVPAVTAAGLPRESVQALLTALNLNTPAAWAAVPGLSLEITAVAVEANKYAYAAAYKTVFLSSLAFTGLSVVMSLLSPNVDNLMTGKVSATLHQGKVKSNAV